MTAKDFLRRLHERGLWLEVSPETGKLAIYGDAEKLTERICDFIRSNRDALIAALSFAGDSVTPESVTKIDDDYCLACGTLLAGPDWLVTLDGDAAFCGPCWEKHHITLECTDLRARVAAWLASAGCSCCGGYDWLVDHDGLLISPCLVKKRQISAIRDQEIEMERKRARQKWDAYAA